MGRRLLLLVDGLLLVTAAFLGVRLYGAWGDRPPAPPESAPAVTAEAPAASPTAPAPAPLTAYAVVAERNLFSATRTETGPEPPRPGTATGPPAPPAPKPRLYGIVLLPEGRGRAYLEDVRRRRVFAYSVGDVVGDSRLDQIKSDRVVMRRGTETFEVLLHDPSKPRRASVQSPQTGAAGRPAAARPSVPAPVPAPAPVPGIRAAGRPRAGVPPPVQPPSDEAQEEPVEEE
jgi:hypothetical protein